MQDENIQAFEQYLRRRSPDRRTPVDYISDVRQFAAVCSKPWREVTMHDIDAFVDGQLQAGLAVATTNRRVAALKAFFDFMAEEEGDLNWPNPVRSKRHTGKKPKRLPRDLHNDDIERLWAVIASLRDQAWFALMLRGGLRVGEIVDLKLSDILDPPTDTQPARVRVYGKGRKERVVLLSADAYAVLAAWLQTRPTSAEPYVFLNERGRPLTANGIEWLLHGYGAQVALEVTPHQLRHTFARQLTEAGMPLPSLSKLMGHAQVTTTQIYTAGADPKLAAAYQTAMAQLSQPASAPTPEPPAASAPQLAVLPLPLPPLPDLASRLTEAPTEIRAHCLAYYEHCRPTWNPRRRRHSADSLLYSLEGFWRWQSAQRPITRLSELTLADLRTYQQTELARGLANTTINRRLDDVLAVLRLAADRDDPVDASVFRYRPLPRPDSLPRHLTDSEYRSLEQHRLSRAQSTDPLVALENALFFVLAHTGIRASECIDLQYTDLDLAGRRLWVRLGKGQRDRRVYLSDTACQAISHYLAGYHRPAEAPLWTRPDGKAVDYNWLKCRLPALGAQIGVTPLTAHRLRHTLATRLLNAGMDITCVQKLLGHEYLATTQIYARIADRTVEADYYQAMRRIDLASMPLSDSPLPVAGWPIGKPAQIQLDNSV